MANNQVIKRELNIKDEVLDIAASKIHFHPNYVTQSQISDFLTEDEAAATYLTKIQTDNLYAPLNHTTKLASSSDAGHIKIVNQANNIVDDANTTITQKAIINYITNILTGYATSNQITEQLAGTTFNNPTITTKSLNELLSEEPGFYKIMTSEATTISIPPNNIYYKNGILEIKDLGGQRIYHLYATSNTGDGYKLNGQEYIKYEDEDWKVYRIPQKERQDLRKSPPGPNVDSGSLIIYENTSGYIFTWRQNNERFKLPMDQNTWSLVYGYKELPIAEVIGDGKNQEYIFGNLIGHCDIKITKDAMYIRSIDKKGEYIEGVNTTFFVPRNNN